MALYMLYTAPPIVALPAFTQELDLPVCSAVGSISGIRPEVQAAISAAVDRCVTQTDLPLPNKRVVSDDSSDAMAMVALLLLTLPHAPVYKQSCQPVALNGL